MADAIEDRTEPTMPNSIYCIKCRAHTDNLEPHEEQIISKGKPRSVVKATCAICTKKKNKFTKTIKNTEEAPQKVKISKKEFEQLFKAYIESVNLKSDN